MNKWDYGGAFERHPIQTGTYSTMEAVSKREACLTLSPTLCFVRIAFLLTRRGRREI